MMDLTGANATVTRALARARAAAPTALQVGGGGAAAAGLYLLAGLAWVLLIGGLTVAAVAIAAEWRGR
ncbi:hypothetical protein [Amycolatopsis sp. YIM 10]|uniref:hypothetical protein n=1 Tax=Amycolatopsis sp. YIM 10 TaxID=2653857 RepID=UPI00129089A8|nr:hypothetical protein [Amycolatopsis sp. YIM 10]QFU87871.1 hypothetical protein YIM_13425 [Amycolatopsis sp. YIM 10]QFU94816.1 hypothetical protein YIM_48455 [Amycolatopsis sp. YIM 10]